MFWEIIDFGEVSDSDKHTSFQLKNVNFWETGNDLWGRIHKILFSCNLSML